MKKIAILFIMVVLGTMQTLSFSDGSVKSKEEAQKLTLEIALALVLEQNDELATLKKEWLVKEAEYKALNLPPLTQRDNELLRPELTQERMVLDLRARAIRQEQDLLERQYQSIALKLLYDVKNQYYEILIQEATIDYETVHIQSLQSAYAVLYPQYLNGLVALQPLDDNQAALVLANQNLESAKAASLTARTALGLQLGGLKLETILLEAPTSLPKLALDETFYNQLSTGAQSADSSAANAADAANAAKRDLTELMEVYSSLYSDKVLGLVEALNEQPRDYETIFDQYLTMTNTSGAGLLVATPEPENYPVIQGFYKQSIPLAWFTTTPNAMTYWTQLPSPVINALVALDLRTHEQRIGLDNLQNALQEPYSNLGLTLIKLQETEKSLNLTTGLAEKIKKANLLGLARYEEVLAVNESAKRLETELQQNRLRAYQQLSQIEYASSGTLGKLIEDKAIRDAERIKASFGLSSPTVTPLATAYWEVNTVDNSFAFNFRVIVPEKLKITHYQLLDANGKALSDPVPIGTSFTHAPLAYAANEVLTLNLYQAGKLKNQFKLSGDALSGTLQF